MSKKSMKTAIVLSPEDRRIAAVARAAEAGAKLPLVTPEVLKGVRFDTDPSVGGTNPVGGKLGSQAGAIDQILLCCCGYLVPIATVKNTIHGAIFNTRKGMVPGIYNMQHVAEKVAGRHQTGAVVLHMDETQYCKVGNAIGINPLWAAKAGVPMASGKAAKNKPARANAGLGKAAKKATKVAHVPRATEASAVDAADAAFDKAVQS